MMAFYEDFIRGDVQTMLKYEEAKKSPILQFYPHTLN